MKKSSFSPEEYLEQPPRDEDIREKDGGKYIAIEGLEDSLDFFDWGTRNFQYQLYKDGYAKLCVAASLELVLGFLDDEGHRTYRCFVGACNFQVESIAPIRHFLATAKSECVKNAASDAGRKFGRGLNDDIVQFSDENVVEKPKPKMKPDSRIKKQFLQAVEAGDQATMTLLENIYEFKREENGEPTNSG